MAICLIFNSKIDLNYCLFVFFSTILAYNFIRLINFNGNRYFIKKYYVRFRKLICLILILTLVLSIYFYLNLDFLTKIILIPLFIITFLYNFEYRSLPRLRNIGLIKILLVAFVWTGLSILVPNFTELNQVWLLKALMVFLYITMITLAFDQRDILIDNRDLKTLPKLFSGYLQH